MAQACKIDHTDPERLPEFLCRVCHPEIILTPEQRAALDAQEAEARRVAQAREAKQRELLKAQRRLEKLEQRERKRGLCTVDEKLKISLEAKVQRLSEELKQ
jgi:hypothetical protein